MNDRPWRPEMTTIAGPAKPPLGAGALTLWIHLDAGFARFDLPRRGPVFIGRSSNCSVFLDHPRISRRHARITVDNGITIEDLGSRNGTAVGEEPLASGQVRPLEVGMGMSFGGLPAVVLPSSGPALSPDPVPGGVVIQDEKMRMLYEEAARLAKGSISVLILGETGVGKERVAEAIHQNSPRADKPLARINCAALTESLLESELFGHEKGAFTGAVDQRQGLLERADGGSVFFDEVGELSLAAQAKMLRVLEEGSVVRVGGNKPRAIDVRFTFATNRDLEAESAAGRFRLDLYYRIGAATLRIPPLRERPDDIEPLARLFIARACRKLAKPVLGLQPDAVAALKRHAWPGNVRELCNVIERAVLLCRGQEIAGSDIPLGKSAPMAPTIGATSAANTMSLPVIEAESDLGSGEDKDSLTRALVAAGGNQAKAASLLGISRATFGRRMDAFGVTRPRKG